MDFDTNRYKETQSAEAVASLPSGTTSSQPIEEAMPALPDYLVRYYRWAYLWPSAVWFFDHQPIINVILFGHYRKIMDHTMRLLQPAQAGSTLQIASVYGELTPKLARETDQLHVIDVAPVQLKAAARKLEKIGETACLARMNAEDLNFADNTFDTGLMFLLLHELPQEARQRSLREAIRVLRRGSRFVIAEYGEISKGHFIHRFAPLRWTLTAAEPFLDVFWKQSLNQLVSKCADEVGKAVEVEEQVDIFGGFYRVVSYRVS